MSVILRDRCVVCGGGGLAEVSCIPAVPVFQGCVSFPKGEGERAPMIWLCCDACGSAQISPLPAMERIYQAGHATGLGGAWARHHAAFAGFLKSNIIGRAVDVGGGSGTLALAYRSAGGQAPWVILEPNALRVPDLPEDIAVVDGFLEREALRMTGASSVVMCHMFEHAIDLRAALDAVTRELPDDGRICLAWPVLETWVEKGVAGALNFEHGVYLTVPRLLTLFAEYGWSVVARQDWAENDTLFLAFARGNAGTTAGKGDGLTAVPGYFESLRSQALYFEKILKEWPGEAFLMPASIYAQALLAAGLSERRFTALLDNAPAKQGKRLFGTDLQVRDVLALRATDRPVVVLNGGAHDAEIARGLRLVRPDVHVVGRHGPADSAAIGRDLAGS